MDVFNITIARQQAEVEVIPDNLSVTKNKSIFLIDFKDIVVLLVLCCNTLFPKRGSNLLPCIIRKIDMFCTIDLN